MTRRTYTHSAYWYACHNGWTHSEAKSLAAQYWDMHTYRPRKNDFFSALTGNESEFDSSFNPLMLAACAMVDVGTGLRETCRRWATPEERAERRAEIACTLRRLRRPFYYARETERRRALAAERRKLHRRRTLAPMPTPGALLDAWNRRKDSRERMIILGGMLHDLECYVDNCLRFDADGKVVGRNGGIRGWLKANLPELSPKYKTLMRYKAMAIRLRQATGTVDPMPTEELLREEPKREFIAELLSAPGNTFDGLLATIEFKIDPATVFAEKTNLGKQRAEKPRMGKLEIGKLRTGKPRIGKFRTGKMGSENGDTRLVEATKRLVKAGRGKADTEKSGTGRDDAGRDDAGRDDAGRDDAGRDDTGRDDTGRDDAGRDDAGRDDTGRTGPGWAVRGKDGFREWCW